MNKMVAYLKSYGLILIALSVLTGCGFKLRGDYLLPESMTTLYVSSTDVHGELTRLVKRHLSINNVHIVKQSAAGIPELRILNDGLDRRTLSLFENGQVAEYELTYTVNYEVIFEGQEQQKFEFELHRNYQDNPDRALAKSRELTLLRTEMRAEAANRILRNLATIQP
ncbi:LPS assembly lipoprotein LptE [Thalassotalea aquiviva]|uniref:LPS-assembly lipoprotein LptE n=1 Tax=Thalassotalea aquiviva TaxID=3242415 RepID=UPI00352B94C1